MPFKIKPIVLRIITQKFKHNSNSIWIFNGLFNFKDVNVKFARHIFDYSRLESEERATAQPTIRRMTHSLLVMIFQGSRDNDFAKVSIVETREIPMIPPQICSILRELNTGSCRTRITRYDDGEFD